MSQIELIAKHVNAIKKCTEQGFHSGNTIMGKYSCPNTNCPLNKNRACCFNRRKLVNAVLAFILGDSSLLGNKSIYEDNMMLVLDLFKNGYDESVERLEETELFVSLLSGIDMSSGFEDEDSNFELCEELDDLPGDK